jgi:hypothetical protein
MVTPRLGGIKTTDTGFTVILVDGQPLWLNGASN